LTNKLNFFSILGIKTAMKCLVEGTRFPGTGSACHIHNLAMQGLAVCSTNIKKEEKEELRELVNFMGGVYLDDLKVEVTHLISDTVRSVKYELAAKKGVKIMHPDWVRNVWRKSQESKSIVRATDEQFDTHKLPCFFSLCITSTGLKLADRGDCKNKVEENGGTYSANFNKLIDILITTESSIGSDKFKLAKKLNKFCLAQEWIKESIEHGYAMPFADYEVKGLVKMSTPTKAGSKADHTISKFNPDSTQLSEISRVSSFNPDVSLSETQGSVMTRRKAAFIPPIEAPYKKVMAQVSLKGAKRLEMILDGYNFYLSGFSNDESQQLGKVLSSLGGIKIDGISDQVTHVIIGADEPKLFNELEDHRIEPVVLKLEWLVAVIEKKSLVNEHEFEAHWPGKEKNALAKPSPASKKAMKSLSNTFKKPRNVPKFQLEQKKKNEHEEDINLVSQYLDVPNTTQGGDLVPNETQDSLIVPPPFKFLHAKYVFIYGYDDPEKSASIIEICEHVGATLVDSSFDKVVDFVITKSAPFDKKINPPVKYKHIVMDSWLDQCKNAQECLEVEYYNRPLEKLHPDQQPLKEEIFVVTNYKDNVRNFIGILVEGLGGIFSETLKASENSILITPTTVGRKFEKTKEWEKTAVSVEWLLECYEKKQRVDETPYLIGGTKASKLNIKRRDSIVPSSQGASTSFLFGAGTASDFDLDPPIENFDDVDDLHVLVTPMRTKALRNVVETTPKTPATPVSQMDISSLCAEMPTPQRQITKAALYEYQQKNAISPRKKRIQALIDTPSSKAADAVESPMPELPDCMKPTEYDYGIRPNSSPSAQWFHKRKLDGLDQNYIPRLPKKTKIEETVPTVRFEL
jgi:topoisomerase (DNA) II binding protein 1